ncbi:hypothetical protein [Pedobacter sp. L105]|uniref:hypothetical protein n=1 Tax=Pedobacter sp. L105 TaxID=1641871 RepID=UPI00131DB4C8|nr:hypothetical protein [Pedobacter sp. L105]
MNQPVKHRITLRVIVILYLLLFLSAIVTSGYLLGKTIQEQPIILITFLKYLLLCILFLVLIVNTLRAFMLTPLAVTRLATSTANFKWLFVIAVVIAIAARTGIFNMTKQQPAPVSNLQIGILILMTLFCFWSDYILKIETRQE